jgi:DNA-binding NtrC family response regulator
MVSTVLVADRDATCRERLREALEQDGFAVEVAADCAEALAYANDFDVVIADIRLDILSAMKARNPSTEVVLVTDDTTLDDAVAAVRRGAFDFVLRPFYIEDMSLTVACAAARRSRLGLDVPLRHVMKTAEVAR